MGENRGLGEKIMNHPLSQAQHLIKTSPNPLQWVIDRMDYIHTKWHRSKGKNAQIRYWKKVKNHIKELEK